LKRILQLAVIVAIVALMLVLATPAAAQDFLADHELRAAWAAYCYPYAAYTDPYTGESWCVDFSFGPYIAE